MTMVLVRMVLLHLGRCGTGEEGEDRDGAGAETVRRQLLHARHQVGYFTVGRCAPMYPMKARPPSSPLRVSQ